VKREAAKSRPMARRPRIPLALAVLLLAAGLAVPVLSSAGPIAAAWSPGPAIYDVAEINNVPVTMDMGPCFARTSSIRSTVRPRKLRPDRSP
jgi:hypothetical protein